MLTKIINVAPPGAYWSDVEIPLVPGSTSPLHIRDVKGLEPPNATINSRGYGILDGEFYTDSHVQSRNVVITVGLNTRLGPISVEEARNIVYFSFPTGAPQTLRFVFDDRASVEIMGFVETVTSDRFVQDLEMQISLICPKPNFLSADTVTVTGQSGQSSPPESDAPYSGDTGGGMIIELFAGGEAYSGDVIMETRVDSVSDYKEMRFNGITIPSGQKLFVSTHRGDKRVEVQNQSELKTLNTLWVWFIYYAANHKFRITTPGSTTPRAWTLTYRNQFKGV